MFDPIELSDFDAKTMHGDCDGNLYVSNYRVPITMESTLTKSKIR